MIDILKLRYFDVNEGKCKHKKEEQGHFELTHCARLQRLLNPAKSLIKDTKSVKNFDNIVNSFSTAIN